MVVVVTGSVVVCVGSVVVCVGSVVVSVGSVVVCVGSVEVVVVSGSGGGGATGAGGAGGARSCCSWKTRFASAWSVSFAPGRKVAGDFVPISPAPVTTRISGSAHELERCERCVDANALPAGSSTSTTAVTPIRRPTYTPDRPDLAMTLLFTFMKIEISPEPSEEERAAILAALAEEAERRARAPWEPEEPASP